MDNLSDEALDEQSSKIDWSDPLEHAGYINGWRECRRRTEAIILEMLNRPCWKCGATGQIK